MFKLRYGYLISGIITGCILLSSFAISIPDGKMHIFFCDVGQGDGAYIRFPDGRDMVVDGGPDDKVIQCLGRHMPFWDRHIDIVVMTHPQKDHMQGLVTIFQRFAVDYFVRSDVDNTTQGYELLQKVVADKKIPVKFITRGEHITVGPSTLSFLWPSPEQIAQGKAAKEMAASQGKTASVLGSAVGDLNDYCLVFELQYGTFDAVFTGDADAQVEPQYIGMKLADNQVEVLKVPHHGSKTGMTQAFVDWIHPSLAVISVGKNSYGHPSEKAIDMLQTSGARVLRTDKAGDIEVVSDGKNWNALSSK